MRAVTSRDTDAMSSVSTQATQTDLEPLIALACELLMAELINNFGDSDEAVLKRIRGMVERILAKCRQYSTTIKGLVGVKAGISPTKDRNQFLDMHAEASKPKQSWHFSIK